MLDVVVPATLREPTTITPLPLGMFAYHHDGPAADPGHAVRAPYVVCAYLVQAPGAAILFDTGIVSDEDAVTAFRPRYFALDDQLGALGVALRDVDVVVNCHLHADHAGDNYLFPGTPILVRELELQAAQVVDYTILEACVAFPGARLNRIRGRHTIVGGVTVVPTPGHSPGHQSLLVESTADGTVLLAGQAFDTASEFATAVLARHLVAEVNDVSAPGWVDELMAADIDIARSRARRAWSTRRARNRIRGPVPRFRPVTRRDQDDSRTTTRSRVGIGDQTRTANDRFQIRFEGGGSFLPTERSNVNVLSHQIVGAATRAAAAQNPGWTVEIVPDLGHAPMLENPELVAGLVGDWLDRETPTGR